MTNGSGNDTGRHDENNNAHVRRLPTRDRALGRRNSRRKGRGSERDLESAFAAATAHQRRSSASAPACACAVAFVLGACFRDSFSLFAADKGASVGK